MSGCTTSLTQGLPEPDAAEVTYPDPLHPEYSRRLKAATIRSNIVEAHADVPTVCIPADHALKLTVSFRPMPLRLRVPVVPSPAATAGPSLAHQSTGTGSGQPSQCGESMPVVVSESAPISLAIEWLTDAAKMQEGYTAFKQGQHHVQMNADVMASWWFAVLFSEHYSRMVSPVQVMAHGHK